MLEPLLGLVFPLGFFVFSVRLILDLMGVELHFARVKRVVLSILFAIMCVGFALVGHSSMSHTTWYIIVKLLFAAIILIMGRRTACVMIKLHAR